MLITGRSSIIEVGKREEKDSLIVLGTHQCEATQGVVRLTVDTDQRLHLLGPGITRPAPLGSPDVFQPGVVQHVIELLAA
ncbi:hypothetical protein D3C84_1165470 [compost metagenome]